jgi:choline transport protein
VYGFLIVWAGNLSVFTTMSELASMAPTSGGQYHWVAMLAPRSAAKFLSYVTGWLTVGGWLGSVASSALFTGNMVLGIAALNWEGFAPRLWQGTLLFWALFLFALIINILASSALPKFEAVVLLLHILGFVATLVPLVVLGPHTSSERVFSNWNNNGGWPSQGLSFMVGLMGNVFAFVGSDAAFHDSLSVYLRWPYADLQQDGGGDSKSCRGCPSEPAAKSSHQWELWLCHVAGHGLLYGRL